MLTFQTGDHTSSTFEMFTSLTDISDLRSVTHSGGVGDSFGAEDAPSMEEELKFLHAPSKKMLFVFSLDITTSCKSKENQYKSKFQAPKNSKVHWCL